MVYFEYISPNYNISLQEWSYDIDHIHEKYPAIRKYIESQGEKV